MSTTPAGPADEDEVTDGSRLRGLTTAALPGVGLLAVLGVLAGLLIEAAGTDFGDTADRVLVLAILLAAVLGLGFSTVRAVRATWTDADRTGLLNRSTALRSGTLLMILCGWAATRPLQSSADIVWAGLATLVALGAISVEGIVFRLARLPVPFAWGLPGIVSPPSVSAAVPAIGIVSVLVTLTGAVLVLTPAPGWAWAVVCLVGMIPTVVVVAHTRMRRRAGAQLRRRLPQALADFAPEFVLYTARPDDASYQVTMWLPYLRRTGRRFVILTRSPLPAQLLAALPALDPGETGEVVPVVCCRTLADLDAAVVPSVRAAFYVNASSGNGSLIRNSRLEHVYLGHGDSDKPPSYNPTHAMYDQIFAAGPAAVRRYAEHGVRVAAEKFRVVGRPQVEAVHPASRPLADLADPVVLYAPTWRGHVQETALSSLDRGEQVVQALLQRGCTVIFRPHPFSADFAEDAAVLDRIRELLARDAARTGRRHLYGPAAETERSALDCMNAADAMVSDVSAVVSDFLFSLKPYAMISAEDDLADFVRRYPIASAAYLVDPRLADLDRRLTEMLGADPLASARRALRADYLGPAVDQRAPEDYARTFVDAVSDVLDGPHHHGDAVAESEDGGSGLSRQTVKRQSLRLLRSLIGNVAAVVALTSALVGGSLALTAAAATIALGLVIGALLPPLRELASATRRRGARSSGASRPVDRLAVLDPVRLALGLTLAATLVPVSASGPVRGDTMLVAVWVVPVLLALVFASVAVESAVLELLDTPGVQALHLPELRVREVSGARQVLAPLCLALALGVGGILGVALRLQPAAASVTSAGASALLAVVALLAVGTAAGAGLQLVLAAARRSREAASAEARLPQVLADRKPAFCVYFAARSGVDYQLGMWLPYLDAIKESYVVVCRSRRLLDQIGDLLRRELGESRAAQIPVVLRETLGSLEQIIVSPMTTVFYVNNALKNTHLIERRELTHVWLNHGDSEKPACFNPVHAIYDVIFAAGQAGVDRYARHGVDIQVEKFTIVGRPQVEDIRGPRGAVADLSDRTVLYAPTWRGPYADSMLYSLPRGEAIVSALLRRGVRVIFRAHPLNYDFADAQTMIDAVQRLLEEDRTRTGRDHLWGEDAERTRSVVECFNSSDAMISDVSAMVSDFLQSTKPFAIVAVGRSVEQLHDEAPAARGGYVIAEDLSNLEEVLDELLGADPLGPRRRDLRTYYLGDFPADRYADGFLQAARAVIAAGSASDLAREEV